MKHSMREDFIDYLKKRQFSHNTLATSKRVVKLYLEWLEIENMEAEQISYQDLLELMKYCSNKDASRSGATQRKILHYMNTVKHFYEHLEEEGRIDVNPVLGVEVKGVKRKVLYHILQPHELHQLYNQYLSETCHYMLKK